MRLIQKLFGFGELIKEIIKGKIFQNCLVPMNDELRPKLDRGLNLDLYLIILSYLNPKKDIILKLANLNK